MAVRRFSPSKLDEARKWLRDNMAAGEVYSAGALQQRAIEDGIKRRTLQLAATYEASVEPHYSEKGIDAWYWKLK